MTARAVNLQAKTPKSELTLSAASEVSREADRSEAVIRRQLRAIRQARRGARRRRLIDTLIAYVWDDVLPPEPER